MPTADQCPAKDPLPEAPSFPFDRLRRFDPPNLYSRLRRERPIFPVTLWNGRRAWLISQYDDFQAVLRDRRFSADMGHSEYPAVTEARAAIDKCERSFIGMDSPRHEHYRRMLTKEF